MDDLRLNPSNRLGRSPLFDKVRAEGAKAWSVYNGRLIGQWFRSMEEDYRHLKSNVQVWDVGGERIVEVSGPDARRLIQMTTPRDLSVLQDDQCAYIPMVDANGGMLNDPVLTRLAPYRFWLALADSDMELYLKGLAAGAGLDAHIEAPDVWIIAVQGPHAEDLVAAIWGEAVRSIRFFRHARVDVAGQPMVLARSGWSGQGGFELHVEGAAHCVPTWEKMMEAGRPWDVRAGCPNLIERIEAGLLSYGNDMTNRHTPFEAGLARFCARHDPGCLAHDALAVRREPERLVRPVAIAGGKVPPVANLWPIREPGGAFAGHVSSAAWSPGQDTNVAISMIERAYWAPGAKLLVDTPDGPRDAVVGERFWGRR